MKALITSDWHLDAVTAGVERFDDLRAAVDAIGRAAEAENADALIFLGDLCDPASNRAHRAVEYACEFASGLKLPSFWLAGNHDVIEDGHGTTVLGPIDSTGATVIDKPGTCMVGNEQVVFLPFTPRSHAYEPEAFIENLKASYPSGKPAAVMGHLNIAGITPGSETHDMPRGREVTYPRDAIQEAWPGVQMFNGHYHERQTFNGIHIPGALERLTFGEEANRPGYLRWEV